MTLVCITNQMPEVRACTITGEHYDTCDGALCHGCIPREATNGLLCHGCYVRVLDALGKVAPWWEALQGVDRAVQRDNAGVRTQSGPPIPIPPIGLAIDEVFSWYRSYPADVDLWVSSVDGARHAIMFTKTALAAFRAHPIEERTTRVARIRCGECQQMNLIHKPPRHVDDSVHILCPCGVTLTLDELEVERERQVRNIANPIIDAGQPITFDRNQAEPYSRENPDHDHLDPLMTRTVKELVAVAEGLEVPKARQLRKNELITTIRERQTA
ncbi:Rho termination factor N-terminal domain-containing protein [Mycetocola miduiensis]|uniref:Rho termination factor, N-terminal domain n=1 Tax=Mycetocola miduiensis TaxID=995034 RepID=A0A1I5AVW6_9MICO|nr:Rho termination factor N-terminal domain-containing protein [Mycetocola miduiensis]SFN66578.1 Rho termination factor, N-terminal domain [Mycetocola miduiensis]